MVEITRNRYFDPRFVQFGLTALFLKIAIYLIQSKTNPTMNYTNTVVLYKGNSSATIHLFGATLTSWVVDGQEMIFVSKKSLFDGKKAIRGGVPVVFPQFGLWELGPQHGFARISKWEMKDPKQIGSDSITLVLTHSASTTEQWNYRFHIEYTISLISEKQLKFDVVITNADPQNFSFTFLLHTYFSVPDVLLCEISGLTGCSFIDKLKGGETFKEERDMVSISEATDRIYMKTNILHKVLNVAGDREITIEKFNLPDTVVWNPWIENAKSMSDFDDDEWKNMICVEAGAVSKPIVLEPGTSFPASQILSVV